MARFYGIRAKETDENKNAGCEKATIRAFCNNHTCAAQLDETCADAKAAGDWQCGVCVGQHGQKLQSCTVEKEKSWCSTDVQSAQAKFATS
jgi:hypothetical protein